MPGLNSSLSAAESIILAIDTSKETRAEELVSTAKQAGAWVIKEGLELQSATSWRYCSELAQEHGLDWVADAKIYDIPQTTAGIVNNLTELDHPPIAITIGTKSGIDSMIEAQKIASKANIRMLGVTYLTSIGKAESTMIDRILPLTAVKRELNRAQYAGIGGFVCSGAEVRMAKSRYPGLFGMIPGARSVGAAAGSQKRSVTPGKAIEGGADLLVIGSQVSGAEDPAEAYAAVVAEIEEAMLKRAA